jgi:hypothetical protein
VGHQQPKGRSQKVPIISWKWKYILLDPEGHSTAQGQGKFIAMIAYLIKREISNKHPNDAT